MHEMECMVGSMIYMQSATLDINFVGGGYCIVF